MPPPQTMVVAPAGQPPLTEEQLLTPAATKDEMVVGMAAAVDDTHRERGLPDQLVCEPCALFP